MASLRKAIDLKCKDCIYDSRAKGTWRQQVEGCTCKDCPLYDFRPKSASKTEETLLFEIGTNLL